MTSKTISISGMTCHHCVNAVRKELSKIPSLEVREVTIGSASVTYDEAAVSMVQISSAIQEAGYSVDV